MAGHIRQQHIGGLEGVVLTVALNHDAISDAHPVLFQQTVEVIQTAVLNRAGHYQQFAAVRYIV